VSRFKAPCEEISKEWLPAIRGLLVEYLYREERKSQAQIAKLLGISQSSVSRYLNEQRGVYRGKFENIPGFPEKIKEIVKEVEAGKLRGGEALCLICRYVRSTV
jgi:hypothetical protein